MGKTNGPKPLILSYCLLGLNRVHACQRNFVEENQTSQTQTSREEQTLVIGPNNACNIGTIVRLAIKTCKLSL